MANQMNLKDYAPTNTNRHRAWSETWYCILCGHLRVDPRCRCGETICVECDRNLPDCTCLYCVLCGLHEPDCECPPRERADPSRLFGMGAVHYTRPIYPFGPGCTCSPETRQNPMGLMHYRVAAASCRAPLIQFCRSCELQLALFSNEVGKFAEEHAHDSDYNPDDDEF